MPRDIARDRAAASLGRAFLGRAFLGLAAITGCLLVLGASVRVHGAGLACPDWPLCFGQVIPTFDFQVFLEWGHRVLASVVSLGFLLLSGLVWRHPPLRARTGSLLFAAAIVLAVQVILGGLTVLKLLAYWSVTLHLLAGNAFFVLLLLVAFRLRRDALGGPPGASGPHPGGTRVLGVALAALVLVQMALGGLVASRYAGLACADWPTCNDGLWIPAVDGGVRLQLLHRFGAYTLLAVAVGFAFVTRRVPALRRPAALVAALVLAQACIGVANVLLRMPVEIAIAHSAVADAIVGATAWCLFRLFAPPEALGQGTTGPNQADGRLPSALELT